MVTWNFHCKGSEELLAVLLSFKNYLLPFIPGSLSNTHVMMTDHELPKKDGAFLYGTG